MVLQKKIIELLNKKGINTESEIREYLSDKPQKTYDPFLLLNMEAGVDLILSSIDEGEKICIYGDYDADGITSTTVLLEVLGELTDNLTYYIPSRFDEGYGLNCNALRKIKENGVSLVITVDCGSTSAAEAEYAKEIGLKMVITDHHTMGGEIPDCVVINPKHPESSYPCIHLAGVGVAFKLAQAIVNVTGIPKSVLTGTLDVVGIGTIGDIVPLVDENRTLAKYGIRMVNTGRRPGLAKLIDDISLKQGNVSSENISFGIVPNLNASGRMKHASIGVKLLTDKNPVTIDEEVNTLIECNRERKRLQAEAVESSIEKVEALYRDDDIFVIELEHAHEGITGIAAGQLKEKYNRPTIIMTPTGDDCLKGTGRSTESVNIYDLLNANRDLFERFGGHAAACGFTIKRDRADLLREKLRAEMKELLNRNPELFDIETKADIVLETEDINMEFAEQLQLLEPFGCANPVPVAEISARVQRVFRMGNKNQYRRFSAVLDDGRELRCVLFRNAEKYDSVLESGGKLRLKGNIGIQEYNGRRYLQLAVLHAEIQRN